MARRKLLRATGPRFCEVMAGKERPSILREVAQSGVRNNVCPNYSLEEQSERKNVALSSPSAGGATVQRVWQVRFCVEARAGKIPSRNTRSSETFLVMSGHLITEPYVLISRVPAGSERAAPSP